MRKTIVSLILVCVSCAAFAQTNQNDWMVGGGFRLNTSKNNTQIGFTPSAGIFVIDNLAVGGNIGIDYSKSGNNKYTSFGVGPFARYYFTTETQAVRPVLHASFNYLSTKNKVGSNASSTNTGTNFFVGGGAAIFISKNVSLDMIGGYDRTKYKNFDGSGGFAFNIGFQVYLMRDQVEKLTNKK